MNVFQKTRKFLYDELHYKFAQFQKMYESFEKVIRIDKLAWEQKPSTIEGTTFFNFQISIS
jgi:hypothetical protein